MAHSAEDGDPYELVDCDLRRVEQAVASLLLQDGAAVGGGPEVAGP